jgi:oxygen-dependent protoporphyrinogen oxidase
MGTLTERLEKILHANVLRNTVVQKLVRMPNGRWQAHFSGQSHSFDGVLLATPAYATSELLAHSFPKASEVVARTHYCEVCSVQLVIDKKNLRRPLDGFGFLVPPNQARPILGALWVSSLFDGRCPKNQALIAVFMGGDTRRDLTKLDDNALVKTALDELTLTTLIEPKAISHRIFRHERAIPQYTLGHRDVIESVEQLCREVPSLAIAGNYLGGISAPNAIDYARRQAVRLATVLE